MAEVTVSAQLTFKVESEIEGDEERLLQKLRTLDKKEKDKLLSGLGDSIGFRERGKELGWLDENVQFIATDILDVFMAEVSEVADSG